MSGLLGHPALPLLLRLRWRAALRRRWRRLRTPKGLVLTLLGGLLFALWIGGILAGWLLEGRGSVDPATLRSVVRVGALAITTLAITGALQHRGLYVPKEEIERLFAAPLSRRALVRYRLLVSTARSAFGGVFLGLITMRHAPVPAFGFLGVLVALLTLPVLAQAASIVAGVLERRVVERLRPLRSLSLVVAAVLSVGLVYLAVGGDSGRALVRRVATAAGGGGAAELLSHPLVVALTLPFEPWARAVTAATWGEAAAWLGASVLLWLVAFEATARLPFDFRELSLETSASVAERIRRLGRSGGGASSGDASRRAAAWRVPWLFGRGAFGAIAWRKTGSILRKSRGTLAVSVLAVAFVTALSFALFEDAGRAEDRVGGAAFVAAVGMFYLAAGLRFDFRDELDRMETLKAWPIGPARLFAAMLVPEAVLVSGLLVAAVFLRAVLAGGVDPAVPAIAATVPPLVFAWVAIDNAVFLVAPVRLVPGQEGALQNAGRGLLLVLVRVLVLGATVLLAAGSGAGAAWAARLLGASPLLASAAGLGIGWAFLLAVDLLLVLAGGAAFRRFDVARDRG